MQAEVPFTLLALIVFTTGAALLAAAIGFMVRRRRHSEFDALGDEVATLRDEIECLRGRIERIEKRDGPPSNAIKE